MVWLAGILGLGACLPAAAQQPLPTLTATPSATASPTATGTIVWFPPTSTPTRFPTPQVTPTVEMVEDLGEVVLEEDFSTGDQWSLGQTGVGSAAIGVNELSLVVSEANAYIYSVRAGPELSDFYVEITASPMLCREMDEYGLLLRFSSPGDFYRFSLSCDGQVRLDRVIGGTASSPQPWTFSGSVPPGAPSQSRLAVWAEGKEMRFIVNGEFQFAVSDPMLPSGKLGVFARSAGEKSVTINFSDMLVRQVNP